MGPGRLKTLNLDDTCIEILQKQKNQSRYARECITRYADVVDELDKIEDRSVKYVAALRHLCTALAECDDWTVSVRSFLMEYMEEPGMGIEQMHSAGYLNDALTAAAVRHVKL